MGLPFSSGIMSPSWSWPNVVHFQVRPARSVTYWPSGVLFARVTCVPLFPLVFLPYPAEQRLAGFPLMGE